MKSKLNINVGDSCYQMKPNSQFYMRVGVVDSICDTVIGIRYDGKTVRGYDIEWVRTIVQQTGYY